MERNPEMKTSNSEPEASVKTSRKEAETRAKGLVREGQERARQTIERAKQEARDLITRAENEAAARSEIIRKKGLLSIEKEVADTLARGKRQSDEMARIIGERVDRAAGFIFWMVTGAEE